MQFLAILDSCQNCGAFQGALSYASTYPFDVIKSNTHAAPVGTASPSQCLHTALSPPLSPSCHCLPSALPSALPTALPGPIAALPGLFTDFPWPFTASACRPAPQPLRCHLRRSPAGCMRSTAGGGCYAGPVHHCLSLASPLPFIGLFTSFHWPFHYLSLAFPLSFLDLSTAFP